MLKCLNININFFTQNFVDSICHLRSRIHYLPWDYINIDINNYFLIKLDKCLIPHEIIAMKVKTSRQPLPPHLSLIFLSIYSVI